ncbi:MAG: aminotransferase class I/II-fold pyridoxal phosphate-dependent enzyme [Pleomorphochaeta sp.]
MAKKNISEILLHQGELDLPFNAVSPPIVNTSIFCFKSYEDFRDALADETTHYLYSRGNNPTVNLCEEKLAALEGAQKAKLVTSGMSAITLSILSCLKGNDHVVAVKDSYSWTKYFFHTYLKRFGVTVTYVEGCNISDFENAIQDNTRLIYLESPTTFTFKLQNLKEVATLAKKHNIKTIIDNTWATPFFQNPISYGIDLVVHSASKYIGGNSDIVAGVIMGSKEDIDKIFETEFQPLGPAPTAMQAWLIMRNMRTLHIRMPYHFNNALKVAKFLEANDKVESVLYPFLESFDQYDLARTQMSGGSGLFSFRLKTRNLEDVKKFTNSLKYFKKAVSWGGYESLVFPAAVKYQDEGPIPEDRISLIRIHVGIEDASILIDDLNNALKGIN